MRILTRKKRRRGSRRRDNYQDSYKDTDDKGNTISPIIINYIINTRNEEEEGKEKHQMVRSREGG
eukprot:8043758-Heterocapsa_arctica.AAC.1